MSGVVRSDHRPSIARRSERFSRGRSTPHSDLARSTGASPSAHDFPERGCAVALAALLPDPHGAVGAVARVATVADGHGHGALDPRAVLRRLTAHPDGLRLDDRVAAIRGVVAHLLAALQRSLELAAALTDVLVLERAPFADAPAGSEGDEARRDIATRPPGLFGPVDCSHLEETSENSGMEKNGPRRFFCDRREM